MDGMVNLTAIWKDAGLQKHQRAGVWAKKDGVEAIKAAASDFGLSVEEVFFSTEGRGRASWGHPRVAEAYALYAAAELRRMRETRTFDISDESSEVGRLLRQRQRPSRSGSLSQPKPAPYADRRSPARPGGVRRPVSRRDGVLSQRWQSSEQQTRQPSVGYEFCQPERQTPARHPA
jgi:hypothetical protein